MEIFYQTLADMTIDGLTKQISLMTRFIQALGGVILLYLVFNLVNFFLNRKKNKMLNNIENELKEIKSILKKKGTKSKKRKLN